MLALLLETYRCRGTAYQSRLQVCFKQLIDKCAHQANMPSLRLLRRPDLFVAIGGGGFFPARVMRTFCKVQGGKNIPIQAIGLSLYEQMGGTDMTAEQIGKEVVRTQWLDFSTLGKTPLLGRRILIVVRRAILFTRARC